MGNKGIKGINEGGLPGEIERSKNSFLERVEIVVEKDSEVEKNVEDDNLPPIAVIDSGTGWIKYGLEGSERSKYCVQTVIGRPRVSKIQGLELLMKDAYFGDEARSKRGILNLERPMELGDVVNWDDMEKLWEHIVSNELRMKNPEEFRFIFTEPPSNPMEAREKMASFVFEKLHCQGFFLGVQALCTLLKRGYTNGIVLDSGYSVSHCVPIKDGRILTDGVRKVNLGGRDVTSYLGKKLIMKDLDERDGIRNIDVHIDIKERFGFVSVNCNEEMQKYEMMAHIEKEYELPNGDKIIIGSELFEAPEIMFNPSLIVDNEATFGLHELLSQTLKSLEDDEKLSQNFILAGGSTKFEGFGNRITQEVGKLGSKIAIKSCKEGRGSRFETWEGAGLMANLPSYKDNWITSEEFYENGPSIVHRKCV